MAGRWVNPKRRKQYRREEETASRPRVHKNGGNGDRYGLTALQQQVGNRAIQQMIAQRQAAQEADQAQKKADELVEAGQVKIEKPVIEEYEVSGNSLAEVAEQVHPPEAWYEYEYQYRPNVENGVIKQVDVTVLTTVHLPRWVGAGWDKAADVDKLAWLRLINGLVGEEDEHEDEIQISQQWIGMVWDNAPERLKTEWQGMLQKMHSQEQQRLDMVLRRVFVLQQHLLEQPAVMVNDIFDKFQQDVADEETAYNEQREFGQTNKIMLNVDSLIK